MSETGFQPWAGHPEGSSRLALIRFVVVLAPWIAAVIVGFAYSWLWAAGVVVAGYLLLAAVMFVRENVRDRWLT